MQSTAQAAGLNRLPRLRQADVSGLGLRTRCVFKTPGRREEMQHWRGARIVASAEKGPLENKGPVQLSASSDDPSYFFEPLLRGLLLGLGAAVVFESAHVAQKFYSLIGEMGFNFGEVAEVLPRVADQFSPLFVGDHVVALGCWILFYIIDAIAIVSVLKRFPNDADGARNAVRNMVTLPKKMLPFRLQVFKQLLLGGSRGLKPAATYSAFTSGPGAPTMPRVGLPPVGTGTRVTSNVVVAPPRHKPPKIKPEEKEGEEKGEEQQPSRPPAAIPPPRPKNAEDVQGSLVKERLERGLKPGEWAVDPLLAKRRKELAGRRSYLKNFWYAAGISEQVGTKPVGVEILGMKLVLFRGKDGTVKCVNDVCPHRGAPLHRGWVQEVNGHDCVVCPYHGWAFDGEGVLRDVPAAERQGEWPEKQLIDVFPVEEKGGFIWLFYGTPGFPVDERPPIPYVPELEDPSWKPVYGSIEFDCNHWSVFENAIDMAHIHYLHNDTFGNQGQPEIREMHCKTDLFGIEATFGLHNKPVSALWEFSKVPEVKVTAKALLPSTSVIAFTLGNGLSFTTFVNTVPINENKTINRFALVRKLSDNKLVNAAFNLNAWDNMARQAMIRILSEDKAMVEELRPEYLPREISVKADMPQTAFRKLRQSYIDLGYGEAPNLTATRFRGDM